MRTMLLSLAGAVSALAVASPAAAQWTPQPSPYGYNGYGGTQGYGYNSYGGAQGYGYNTYGAANLQSRIAGVRQTIWSLQRQGRLRGDEARQLSQQARELGQRARQATYSGNPYQMQQLQVGVARLEQRVQYAATYGNRNGYGAYGNQYNSYGAQNGYYGRDDRNGYDRDNGGDDDGD